MLPKKQAQVGSSKTAEQKKKDKIIKDKTFVLKDKKEAKQKFIKAVTHQVKFGHQNSHQVAQSETEKKLRKDDKKKELQELKELFKTAVTAQKISKGAAGPQAVVCAFFKYGQCNDGDKCKFSHDSLWRQNVRSEVFTLMKNFKKMLWEIGMRKKLEEVMNKKHGEAENKN